MPDQENIKKYGMGHRAGSLGKLKEIWRTCEGICEKPIKIPGAGWGHWLDVWKSYSNLGHWAGLLGKLNKKHKT